MSGPPGIVYQTWRSIRSIHWWHFSFRLSNMTVYSFHTLSTISRKKMFLTRKSWFTFLDVTESKNQWLKITIVLGPVSVCSFPVPSFLHTSYTIDRCNHLHICYPFFGAASRPTWSEPPTVSFPSFGPVELLLLHVLDMNIRVRHEWLTQVRYGVT